MTLRRCQASQDLEKCLKSRFDTTLPSEVVLSECNTKCYDHPSKTCYDECLLESRTPATLKLSMMKDKIVTQACESVCPEGSEICITMCKPETNDLLQMSLVSPQSSNNNDS